MKKTWEILTIFYFLNFYSILKTNYTIKITKTQTQLTVSVKCVSLNAIQNLIYSNLPVKLSQFIRNKTLPTLCVYLYL